MKRLVILLSLIPVVFLLGVASCAKKPSEDQLFGDARKLQEEGKYAEAVTGYEKLIQVHPKGKYAPQAQFMIGFICANELKDLAKAEKAYKAFLEKYAAKSDSGMVASARWELENLGKDINQIEDLSGVIGQGEPQAADTAKAAVPSSHP
jgi:outer membrane protein assembly factor BamD (BamD/ComL family)